MVHVVYFENIGNIGKKSIGNSLHVLGKGAEIIDLNFLKFKKLTFPLRIPLPKNPRASFCLCFLLI